jgi:solute:Na+ symporter, SSS family
MSAWFDLTGTMIITSFLYLLGPRGLYIEFRGGAVLVLAFLLAYTAKWHRRSGCMTSAEWNTYRFGAGFSGELVRFLSALSGIIMTIGLLGYFVRGATLFMAMVFPVNPVLLTCFLISCKER